MVRALDLLRKSQPFRFQVNNLGQVVHTHVPVSPFTKQYDVASVKGR